MMATVTGTCEIVESKEEDLDSDQRSKGTDIQSGDLRVNDKAGKRHMPKYLHNSSLEDDLNQLFQGIDLRASGRALRLSHQKDRELSQKNALKKPIKIGAPQASGIGISETVTLKQALRGLCISQKLETAAMKRLSRPSSGLSEAGTIKRLYRAVVVDASEGDLSSNGVKGSMVEISLVPEDDSFNCSKKMPEILQVHKAKELNQIAQSSLRYSITPTTKVQVPPKDEIIPESTETGSEKSNRCPGSVVKPKPAPSSSGSSTGCKVIEADESVPASTKVGSITSMPGLGRRDKFQPVLSSATSSSSSGSKVTKSASTNQRLARPVFRNKNLIRKKVKLDSSSATSTSGTCCKIDNDLGASTSKSVSQIDNYTGSNLRKEPASPASTSTNLSVEVSSNNADTIESSLSCTLNKCSSNRCVGGKANATLRPREKGECSQSSKSSIGEYSSSTSVSEESNLSGSSCCGSRPHMSKDLRWEAIHHVQIQHGSLGFRHFKLLKRLGCGDIGTVYLAELSGTNCVFALKVMDNELLVSRKKMPRAQTEREILQVLDHPFLPTLYAHFTTEKLSCLVMEYCPGGDLHVLRQKQPGRSFPEEAARFYVAEVLLALEYLHMLGVVYRDLKPENILVREDGHIMLSDFDLSLRCTVSPTILRSSSYKMEPEKVQGPCADSSCIDPFCLHPSWVQVSCFSPKLISATAKNRKLKSDVLTQVSPLPQLVAEPTNARSNSFVGTHEYLAPEIIKAEGHGSAVDWWTFGIFMYELLFGKTPFKGRGDEDTLANVVSQGLNFPEGPVVSFQAKDLIRGLLVKEPENRLGSLKGATEIKMHPFFEGLNWALIRCEVPPEIPRFPDLVAPETESYNNSKCVEIGVTEAHLEFNLF